MKALRILADWLIALAFGLVAGALAFHHGARYARRLQREGLAYHDSHDTDTQLSTTNPQPRA